MFKPRRRSAMPDWPDEVEFDEEEDVITIDAEGNYDLVNNLIQPHDVWHANGVKYFVSFNEYYQPLQKGGIFLLDLLGMLQKMRGDIPKRPVGYGFGVKQSDLFGVRSILRKEKFQNDENDSLALQNMEKKMANLTETNEGMLKQNQDILKMYNKNNDLLKNVLDVLSTGKTPTRVLNLVSYTQRMHSFADDDDDDSVMLPNILTV
ncbi:hypothetical protein KSS87_001072 [Heliosperma pusillum]|nr:hypothetical protein KSS87_001072 [Heliosperma pusillum]